jgi:DNA-binding response OmpR family regulator
MSSIAIEPPSSRLKILVVEDDPAILNLIARALQGTYDVTTVSDGRDAVVEAGKIVPDLILLDVNLPGLDGFSVAQNLKQDARFKRTPIMFVTARDRPADTIRGIQVGAKHYITKPFKLEDLMSKVEKALNPANQAKR